MGSWEGRSLGLTSVYDTRGEQRRSDLEKKDKTRGDRQNSSTDFYGRSASKGGLQQELGSPAPLTGWGNYRAG